MATKSILNNVMINKAAKINFFVSAMECAQKKAAKDVQYSRTVSDVKGDELKALFDSK